ncbi:MAG: malonyl-ACP O-methyltransferase BioC [Fusobacteria bacterium]|nr:malonyl-ACP O-methyltransferase BioC [Fusobacteriota bacterium]
MKIEKHIVSLNFSKGVNTYNSNAIIQNEMSMKLIMILKSKIKNKNYFDNILELGCGTGIFTDMLVQNFPNSNFLLTDISSNMINYIMNKYVSNKNYNYINCDAETYQFNHKYDLIGSNAVFQWYHDLHKAIQNYNRILNKDGILLFSTYGEKTYYELKNVFKKIYGENYFIQNFYKYNYIESILKEFFSDYEIREEIKYQYFNSLMEYFKHIKSIGANSALKDKAILTPNKYKEAEKEYSKKYMDNNGKLRFTNHLIYVYAKK